MAAVHQYRSVTRLGHRIAWFQTKTVMLLIIIAMCVYYLEYQKNSVINSPKNPKVIEMYKQWQDCMIRNLTKYRDASQATEFWKNLAGTVSICEQVGKVKKLKIEDFKNGDEVKRHIMPLTNTPSTILTLGVGQDTKAEEALKLRLPPNSKFYGADPIIDINEKLYSKVGSFFPFAVGARPGMFEASVLVEKTYVNKTVATIDLPYFLIDVIGQQFFDSLWIDAEYAEYDMLPFFEDGGELDENEITVCQFNLELHLSNDFTMKQKAHSFFWKILDNGRYGIFRVVDVGHLRLFFVNFRDPKCISTYLSKEK